MKRALAALALTFALIAPASADLEDDCRFVASWVHAVAIDRDNGALLADTVHEIDRAAYYHCMAGGSPGVVFTF